jgi:predicted GNAT family acetyltransferase
MAKHLSIRNNAERWQYEAFVGQSATTVDYLLGTEGDIYLTRVEVSPDLVGQGIATAMVSQVMQDIAVNGYRLVPVCPFIVNFLRAYPEWKRLLKTCPHHYAC